MPSKPFPSALTHPALSGPRPAWNRTRVLRKLSPQQVGALKLARRFGDLLVCVRYRHDPDRQVRYTTVELVVDSVTVRRRTLKIPDSR